MSEKNKLSNSRIKGSNKDKVAARNIRAETRDADRELNDLSVKFRPGAVTGNNMMPGGPPANEFPARFTEVDDRDHRIALKASLIEDPTTGATPFGQAQLTKEDLDWIESKRQIAQYLDLQVFIENFYDIKDPAHRALIKDLYPEYFERRLEYLKQMSDLQMQLAEIQLYGPRTRKDLHVLYEISKGTIPLPRGPLWDPQQWHTPRETSMSAEFRRGLLNVRNLRMRNVLDPGGRNNLFANDPRTMTDVVPTFRGVADTRSHNPIDALVRTGVLSNLPGRRLQGF